MKPGNYTAKIVEYGLPAPEPGKKPCCTVTFEFQEDGQNRRLTWFGYLSDAAIDKTIEQLLRCGLKSDSITALLEPGALDLTKDLSISVENETFEGKVRTKIKWINEIGGMKFEQMAKDQARTQFGKFDAWIKAKRAEMGVPKPTVAKPMVSNDFAPPADDYDLGA